MDAIEVQNIEAARLQLELQELADVSKKLKKLYSFRTKVSQKIKNCHKEHKFFQDNHVCPTCTQDLSEEFRAVKIEEGNTEIGELEGGFKELEVAIIDEENRETKFTELSG